MSCVIHLMVKRGNILIECIQNLVRTLGMSDWDYVQMNLVLLSIWEDFCWSIILTPYNLPPGMCMKREFMFLIVLIPGPSDPRHKIDVYLQPLIDDLCTLWNDGIPTFDVSLKQNFFMKAALMWTINDFPAYGMLSSWTTAGRLGCPICME